jgi:hypothetical protein
MIIPYAGFFDKSMTKNALAFSIACQGILRSAIIDHGLASSAAWTVFCISMAMVIGPTPPGTGVIQLATSLT